jgi:co-chaperonin GroES (HSP10)
MLNPTKVKPLFNYLITTKDEYTENDTSGGIIVKSSGCIKEYQKVIAVGPMVREIKPGDIVCINPRRYAKFKHPAGSLKDGVIEDNPVTKYEFNIIELNHIPHLLLLDQDITFIVEESIEEADKPNIIVPDKKIVL